MEEYRMKLRCIILIYFVLFMYLFYSYGHTSVTPYFNTPAISRERGAALCKEIVIGKIQRLISLKEGDRGLNCSIQVAMYDLDDPDILELLVNAQARGIIINLLLDRGAYNKKCETIEQAITSRLLASETFKIQDRDKKIRIKNAFDILRLTEGTVTLIGNPHGGSGRPRTMHEKFSIFSCVPAGGFVTSEPSTKIKRKMSPPIAGKSSSLSAATEVETEEDEAIVSKQKSSIKEPSRARVEPEQSRFLSGSGKMRAHSSKIKQADAKEEQESGDAHRPFDTEYSLLMGSYNWTDAAAAINYENCLLINEHHAVIQQFAERFSEIQRKK